MRYQPIVPEKTFNHIDLPFNDYKIERSELNGKRVYYVNDDLTKPLYSITTVLGSADNEWIEDWKKAVGEVEARKVSQTAANIGTQIHGLAEHYLLNQDINPTTKNNMFLYHRFKKFIPALDRIDNVRCLEKQLYSKKLGVAGTVDCVAEFDEVLSIIDFKTSNKFKSAEEIPNYFAQATAYAMMVYELFGIKIKQVVILISMDAEDPLIYISNIGKHIDYLIEVIKNFNKKLKEDSDE